MNNLISLEDKIYVAGSTGMVGRSICKALKKDGYGNSKLGGKLLVTNRKDLDLTNNKLVNEWFDKNKPKVVILAAAKVGGIHANAASPATFLLENLKIQTNVIEAAWRNNAKRLLFLGSSCIYPKFANQPITEESLLAGELESSNEWYAIAKIAGLKLCASLRLQYGFDTISLMPTNLYGPGDNYHPFNSHVMAALLRKFYEAKKRNLSEVICWGSGSPMREFMHVDDLAKAVIFALKSWNPNSSKAPKTNEGKSLFYLNVGTGKDISIKDLAEKIANILDFKGKITWDPTKPNGTPKKLLDISRLSKLGWNSQITLNDGIIKTLETIGQELNLNE
tara:strand:- start:161 stop:1168 length:1008 start_codon:yes stop_codon:yes gene_type:complete